MRLGASSCARTGTQTSVFKSMAKQNMDVFLQLGDIHYVGHNRLKYKSFKYALYEVFNKNKA